MAVNTQSIFELGVEQSRRLQRMSVEEHIKLAEERMTRLQDRMEAMYPNSSTKVDQEEFLSIVRALRYALEKK